MIKAIHVINQESWPIKRSKFRTYNLLRYIYNLFAVLILFLSFFFLFVIIHEFDTSKAIKFCSHLITNGYIFFETTSSRYYEFHFSNQTSRRLDRFT